MLTVAEREALALEELAFASSAPHTLEEIAKHLGLSVTTIARIEARALKKMRRRLRGRESWAGGLREPSPISRRLGEPFETTGAATTPWSDGGQHDG